MKIATVEQALMSAATAMQARDADAIEAIIAVVQDWLGDHSGLLAALQEMADATALMSEEGL